MDLGLSRFLTAAACHAPAIACQARCADVERCAECLFARSSVDDAFHAKIKRSVPPSRLWDIRTLLTEPDQLFVSVSLVLRIVQDTGACANEGLSKSNPHCQVELGLVPVLSLAVRP